MLKAQKGNRVVRIDDTKAEMYRTLGYTVTDMAGHLIATPDNAQQRIRELEAENACLLKQLADAKAAALESGKKDGKKGSGKKGESTEQSEG